MSKNVRITVAPTMLDDLPALAECELLAFSGYNDSGDSDNVNKYAQLCAPFRVPLARSKIAPRFWPDYEAIIRKRRAQLQEGTVRYFTARVHESEDDVEVGTAGVAENINEHGPDGNPVNRSHFRRGRIVGLLTLELPATQIRAKRANKGWTQGLLSDYVYPTFSTLTSKFLLPFGLGSNAVDGCDHDFLKAAKSVIQEGRVSFSEHWECFIMYVHSICLKAQILTQRLDTFSSFTLLINVMALGAPSSHVPLRWQIPPEYHCT